jgi:hypothetical protein
VKNNLNGSDLSGLPQGFTVSYDGNTYDLKIGADGDVAQSIESVLEANGVPTDSHIVVTAPNGDSIKLGPDAQPTFEQGIAALKSWSTDELKSFVSHPARKQSRVAVSV